MYNNNNVFSPLNFMSTQDFSRLILNPDTSHETFEWLQGSSIPGSKDAKEAKPDPLFDPDHSDESSNPFEFSDFAQPPSTQLVDERKNLSNNNSAESVSIASTTASNGKRGRRKRSSNKNLGQSDDEDSEYSRGNNANHSDSEDEEEDTLRNREWSTVFTRDSFMETADTFHIKHRTRRELPRETVEHRLYSSLKYVVLLEADEKEFKDDVHFLLARVSVVDADTLENLDDNFCVKPLNGTIESALTKPPDSASVLKGQLLLQLSNKLSYHKHKRKFCLEIKYFTPDDLTNEVCTKRSPSFRVYARKPNSGKSNRKTKTEKSKTSKKRKRETSTKSESNKKIRSDLHGFMSKLEDLVSYTNNLSAYERQMAVATLAARSHELVSTGDNQASFFSQQLMSSAQQQNLQQMQQQSQRQYQQQQQHTPQNLLNGLLPNNSGFY